MEGGFFSPDSIIGLRHAGKRFAVFRDSVAFVQARTVSASQTFLGIGAAALAAVAIYYANPNK